MTRAAKTNGGFFWRLRRSRGVRKFSRNRLAMVALGVIALYAFIAGWIILMESVNWVGRKTEAFTLEDSPVLGMFLPSRTLERVGPPNLAGMGKRQTAIQRANQYDFFLRHVGEALKAAELATPENGLTPEGVLASASLAERRLAPLPLEELEALHQQGLDLFDEYDDVNMRMSALSKIRLLVERIAAAQGSLERARTALAEAADAPEEEAAPLIERVEFLTDDLSLTLEELGFALEDYQALESAEGPLAEMDPGPLFAASEAAREPPSGAPAEAQEPAADAPAVADQEMLDRISELALESRKALEAEAAAQLDKIEPVVRALMPVPEGLSGAIYKLRTLLGTDRQGRSILIRAIYSAKIAVQVGVVAALISVVFGSIVGAAAAFFGGWVDHAVIWVYTTLSSIPYLVLLTLLAFVFQASDWTLPWDPSVRISTTLIPLYTAFCLTFWIGPARVIRGEALKIKELEYVQAATAIGFGRPYILLKHILPNTAHLMFINFSLLFIAAIKSEVVLTFLGLGLKEGASWGIMISQAIPEVVTGFFWQIGAATAFMLVLVLAFNILSDALQDAFDPKHVG